MKRSSACAGLILCLLSLTGCSLEFQDFSAPDGSYSVRMPGTPKRSPTPGVSGEAWEVVTRNWNFGVASMTMPSEVANLNSSQQAMAIDMGVQSMASAMRGTTKSSNVINLNGFQGKEVEMSIAAGANPSTGKQEPATSAVMRIYLVNSKLMLVMARSTNSITKDSPDVKTFFDSFKLNATASPSTSNMAGMSSPGMNPPGMATSSSPMPAGYPVAGATGYPMPTTSAVPDPMQTSATAGGYQPPNASGTASSSNPMPSAVYPPPAGSSTNTTTASPYNPMGTSTTPSSSDPMPSASYPPAAGTTTGQGFNNPMATSAGNAPGQFGNRPQFTGEPVTEETKLTVGDMLQVSVNNQWVDVKIQKVFPNGMVQVRSLTKPPVSDTFPRSAFQLPPGAGDTEVASNDSPRTDPSGLPNSKGSGLPNSKSTGLPNSKGSGFSKTSSSGFGSGDSSDSEDAKPAPKSKSSGFGKTTDPKPESTSKSTGLISLDGATVDELLAIIGKKTEHRKVQAAEKLRDHSDAGPNPEVAKKILALMKTDELTVKAGLAQALEKWASPEINDAVIKNLTGGTTEVRQSMMRIAVANNVEDVAERVAQRLTDAEDRKVAAEVLVGIGESAQGPVIKLLNTRDGKLKLVLCEILGQIGTADALTALNKAAGEWMGKDRIAARAAIKALEAKK